MKINVLTLVKSVDWEKLPDLICKSNLKNEYENNTGMILSYERIMESVTLYFHFYFHYTFFESQVLTWGKQQVIFLTNYPVKVNEGLELTPKTNKQTPKHTDTRRICKFQTEKAQLIIRFESRTS